MDQKCSNRKPLGLSYLYYIRFYAVCQLQPCKRTSRNRSCDFGLFRLDREIKIAHKGVPPIKQVLPAKHAKGVRTIVRTPFYSRAAIRLPCVEKRRFLHCVLSVFWITIILPSRFNHIIQEKFPHEFIIVIHSQDLGMFTYFFKN